MKTQPPPAQETHDLALFLDGATHGHILYRQMHQGKTLSPAAIYDLLMRMLLDTTHPSLWNAGYISGWFAAKHQAEERAAPQETPVRANGAQCLLLVLPLMEE